MSVPAGRVLAMRNERATATVCFRAATTLEATTRALLDSARELEAATDDAGRAAAAALKAAQQQLLEAKRVLQAAATARAPLHVVR
jgi:hypothetical protein